MLHLAIKSPKGIYILGQTHLEHTMQGKLLYLSMLSDIRQVIMATGKILSNFEFRLHGRDHTTIIGLNKDEAWVWAWQKEKVDVNLSGPISPIEWLIKSGHCVTGAEARRLIQGGGFHWSRDGFDFQPVHSPTSIGMLIKHDQVKVGERGDIYTIK